MICSNCFSNFGFKATVKNLGDKDNKVCPTCGTSDGIKVTEKNVDEIVDTFFMDGSVTPEYLIPLFRTIDTDPNIAECFDYQLTEDVIHDLHILKETFKRTVFNPLINMVHGWGDSYLKYSIEDAMNMKIRSKNKLNDKLRTVLDILIKCCKTYHLKKDDLLFRVRKNPLKVLKENEYDSPPKNLTKSIGGRLNNQDVPLFYCSNDPDTCLYESNFGPTDTLILATYNVTEDLLIIDLENLDSEFIGGLSDSLYKTFNERDIFFFLDAITRSKRDYVFLQLLCSRINENGFVGIKYKSFYDRYREDSFSNIAIFGYPLSTNLLSLRSLNRMVINEVKIKWTYGPALGIKEEV